MALAMTSIAQMARPDDNVWLSNDDTINVTADEAWEERGKATTHFQGNFRLLGPDWSVSADKAVLYGPLDNPDKVIAQGNPARIVVRKTNGEGEVVGVGSRIEYRHLNNVIELTGEATVTDADNIMTSSVLSYDLTAERIIASGPEGVKMTLDPNSR